MLAINASGIAMGYNHPTDGTWKNAVVVSSTGDVTISGTLTAGSIISTTATVDGTTMATIKANAAAGASINISGKLDKQATYILGTDFALKTNGYDAGNGIVITDTGILAKKGGVPTFAIDSSGDATFKGNITGSTGTFSGNIQANSAGVAYTPASGFDIRAAIGGYASAISGKTVVSVYGAADSGCYGVGGFGVGGNSTGVFGYTQGTSSVAIRAQNTSGNTAIEIIQGTLKYGAYTLQAPNGNTAQFLRGDGNWASPPAAPQLSVNDLKQLLKDAGVLNVTFQEGGLGTIYGTLDFT